MSESTRLDRTENVQRLDALDTAYRKLGGAYAEFADHLATRREWLLDEARSDMGDFALLTEAWGRWCTRPGTPPYTRHRGGRGEGGHDA